jgi:Ankyrin repeats (3 copies)
MDAPDNVGEGVVEDVGATFATLDDLSLEDLQAALEARPELCRVTDARGWTLLHRAVDRGWEYLKLKFVIQARHESVRQVSSNGGQLPIHLVNHQTCSGAVYLLARQYPESLHISYGPDDEEHFPFFCAIKNGASVQTVLLSFMLRYEPKLPPGTLRTIWKAAGHFELIGHVLGGHGEREFSPQTTARDGHLALHLALQAGASTDREMLRLLCWAWPDSIRLRSPHRGTPLHFAVVMGAPHGVLDYLVMWQPEMVRERDDYGCLPIHCVRRVRENWTLRQGAQLLINEWPESLQERSNNGEVPLHAAARSDSLPLVQYLVEQYPEGVRVRSNDGMLPLHNAAKSGSLPSVQSLVERFPEGVRVRSNDGSLPLHNAARSGSLPVVRYPRDAVPRRAGSSYRRRFDTAARCGGGSDFLTGGGDVPFTAIAPSPAAQRRERIPSRGGRCCWRRPPRRAVLARYQVARVPAPPPFARGGRTCRGGHAAESPA